MDFAFAYVIANNGIDTEESYPYEPRVGLISAQCSRLVGTLRRVLQRTRHFRPVSLPDQNVFNSIKDKGNTLAYIPEG